MTAVDLRFGSEKVNGIRPGGGFCFPGDWAGGWPAQRFNGFTFPLRFGPLKIRQTLSNGHQLSHILMYLLVY